MNTNPPVRPPPAFSLVELLVVMGIIGLMAVLAVPAFQSLAGSKGIVNAANVIQTTLEFARSEAQTRQTYVWVALKDITNSSSNNEILMSVAYSMDGTATNSATTNVTFLTRLERFENVKLLNTGENVNTTNIMSLTTWPTLILGTNTFSKVITFTPSGQVIIPSEEPTSATPYISVTDIVLASTRGTTNNTGDKAIIDIIGATGAIKRNAVTNP